MSSLLLVLLLVQIPCGPFDLTVTCQCKQGIATSCQALRTTRPDLADEIAKAVEAAATLAQLEKSREEGSSQQASEVDREQSEASDDEAEPPDCKGQEHHIISKPIAKALARHLTLRGLYQPRDPRFVAQARDKPAHCGYQQWHRDLDNEVVEWLKANRTATPQQFEEFLRSIYNRAAMRARFPNGF